MRVLMLLETEFPPDDRVDKEIQTITSLGIEIDLACLTRSNQPEFEDHGALKIYRRTINKLLYKVSAASLILPNYFNFWDAFLKVLFRKKKYDIIHVHDLPLSKIAKKYRDKYNLKLVCDQHEYYSDWIVKTSHYNNSTGKIINLLSNWKKYEKKYLSASDCVITVELPLKNNYAKEHGINPDKIIVVPNTPSGNIFNISNVDQGIIDRYSGKFMIFYAGGIDNLRGLEFVIEQLNELSKKISDILFVVAGRKSSSSNFDQVIKQFKAEPFIEYIGFIRLNQIPSYIRASKICVSTPKVIREDVKNTILTKIYQYIALGRPVIISSADMMKEFVEKNELGYSVEYGDSENLKRVIMEFYEDPLMQKRMETACLKTAKSYYWEITAGELVKYYRNVKEKS